MSPFLSLSPFSLFPYITHFQPDYVIPRTTYGSR